MRHLLNISVIVVGVMLLAVPGVLAGKKKFDWDEVSRAEWDIAPDSSQKIFDAAFIFKKVIADDKELMDDDYRRTVYHRIRILGPSGRDWADVEVPYYYKKQKIKDIWGRTILPDGNVIELTEDNIFEKEKVKGEDLKLKVTTFSLPGVTDDCIIEYAFRYELPGPVRQWVIQEEIPVLSGELRWILAEIKVPTQDIADWLENYLTPNYLWLNTFARPRVTELPNVKKPETLFFEIGYVPPFEEHPHSIPATAQKTKLYNYYGSNKPPASYWGDKSADVSNWLEEFGEKNKRVKKLVARWANLGSNEEKIAAAYRWVQDSIFNLTYFDLVDEKGKEKEPKDIETADHVMKYRYGYRTHIDRLFCDVLLEMNIKAKHGYLKDRIDDLFVREAKYWQLDRSIVAVENSGGSFDFYSPGHLHTPINQVPWYCEGVEALIGGGSEYTVAIPFSDASINQSNVMYQFAFSEDLEISGSMTARMTGHDARSMRITLTDEDSTDFKDLLEEELLELVPDAEIDSIEFSNYDSCLEPFHISGRLEYPAVSTAGNRILLKPFDYVSPGENPFTDPERQIPVLFGYGYTLKESVQFELPEGYVIEALPKEAIFRNGVGQCSAQFQQVGNMLTAQRFFTLNSPFWGAQDYAVVRALFQARADQSGEIVILTQATEESSATD